MHNQWGAAVPSAHETQKIRYVPLVRHDVTVKGRGDVVQSQPKMIFGDNGTRPFNWRLVPNQRYDVQRTSLLDGFMQAGERTNVNHGS